MQAARTNLDWTFPQQCHEFLIAWMKGRSSRIVEVWMILHQSFLKTQLHIWCKCVLFAPIYYFPFVRLFTFNVICKGSASWIHCFMNATEFLVTAEFLLSVAPQTITNNEKVILPGIIRVLPCYIWYLANEIKIKIYKISQINIHYD